MVLNYSCTGDNEFNSINSLCAALGIQTFCYTHYSFDIEGVISMVKKIKSSKVAKSSTLPPDIAKDVALVHVHYPTISEKITQLWGTSEFIGFLDSILFDERGNRQGFPADTASALLRLYKNHTN